MTRSLLLLLDKFKVELDPLEVQYGMVKTKDRLRRWAIARKVYK